MIERRAHRGDAIGRLVVLQHCTFEWRQPLGRWQRFVAVRRSHCSRCVEELRRIAPLDGFLVDRRKRIGKK
jgi:hypothetical protein